MRERRAEHGHDRIANELLHGPAKALELCPEPQVVRRQHGADILGVHLLGAGREPDEIGEQDRDDLSLFLGLCPSCRERRTACQAEPGSVGVFLAAALAVLYRHHGKPSDGL